MVASPPRVTPTGFPDIVEPLDRLKPELRTPNEGRTVFPFWIELSLASLTQWAVLAASASWMFLTWLGGGRA